MNSYGLQALIRSRQSGSAASKRLAFTLVELLVVIVIIAILIALLVPTIGGALQSARDAQMGIEVSSLAQALEAYRSEMNEYPPDFAGASDVDTPQVAAHLARKFRYRNATAAPPQGDMVSLAGLDPAEALVFWLGGFSGDPRFPLAKREAYAAGTGLVKGSTPFFEFDVTRLRDVDSDGYPEYYPESSELPYVYLRADHYELCHASPVGVRAVRGASGGSGKGHLIRAYAAELDTNGAPTRYAAEDKFQIICAGQDGEFLPLGNEEVARKIVPQFAEGIGYTDSDSDNITNFSEGKTLGNSIP